MTNIQIPSGLIDENIELFSTPSRMMATHDGQVKLLFDLPKDFLEILNDEMNSSPATLLALSLSGYKSYKAQLEKFTECRFGGFDFVADFKDGKLSQSEYHECGFRGNCPMEGVVCNFFKVNGEIISPLEIKMIHLLATEDILPVIAEKLAICMNTFEVKKQLLFRKLRVLSRPRLVAVCYDLQILNVAKCL